MRCLVLAGVLALLAGCSGTGNPVQAPAPRRIPEHASVRIWSDGNGRIVYRARVSGDSLTGSVRAPGGEATRFAMALADIDSLQVRSEPTAMIFLAGAAAGAIFVWRILVGGF